MAKKAFISLTGGLNDVDRPDTLGEDQLQECVNYEIAGVGRLKKRTDPSVYDADLNILLAEVFLDGVNSISEPFYPPVKPENMTGDFIILVDGVSEDVRKVEAFYEGADGWIYQDENGDSFFADINNTGRIDLSNVPAINFAIGNGKIIIYDGINPLYEFFVRITQRDISVQFSGLSSPKNRPVLIDREINKSFSGTELDEVLYSGSEADSIGTTGIIQCKYTVVSDIGEESNPSPLSESLSIYNHKIASDGVADERFVSSFEVKDLSTPLASEEEMKKYKYFNIYFSVHKYLEGGVADNLEFCQQVTVKNKSSDEFGTGNNYTISLARTAGKIISYENDSGIAAIDIDSSSGIFMAGGIKRLSFGRDEFKYKCRIDIGNLNSKNYIDGVYKIRLTVDEIVSEDNNDIFPNWSDFFNLGGTVNSSTIAPSSMEWADQEYSRHLRFFLWDFNTPLSVYVPNKYETNSDNVQYLDLFIKIPQIVPGENSIYLCWNDIRGDVGSDFGYNADYNDVGLVGSNYLRDNTSLDPLSRYNMFGYYYGRWALNTDHEEAQRVFYGLGVRSSKTEFLGKPHYGRLGAPTAPESDIDSALDNRINKDVDIHNVANTNINAEAICTLDVFTAPDTCHHDIIDIIQSTSFFEGVYITIAYLRQLFQSANRPVAILWENPYIDPPDGSTTTTSQNEIKTDGAFLLLKDDETEFYSYGWTTSILGQEILHILPRTGLGETDRDGQVGWAAGYDPFISNNFVTSIADTLDGGVIDFLNSGYPIDELYAVNRIPSANLEVLYKEDIGTSYKKRLGGYCPFTAGWSLLKLAQNIGKVPDEHYVRIPISFDTRTYIAHNNEDSQSLWGAILDQLSYSAVGGTPVSQQPTWTKGVIWHMSAGSADSDLTSATFGEVLGENPALNRIVLRLGKPFGNEAGARLYLDYWADGEIKNTASILVIGSEVIDDSQAIVGDNPVVSLDIIVSINHSLNKMNLFCQRKAYNGSMETKVYADEVSLNSEDSFASIPFYDMGIGISHGINIVNADSSGSLNTMFGQVSHWEPPSPQRSVRYEALSAIYGSIEYTAGDSISEKFEAYQVFNDMPLYSSGDISIGLIYNSDTDNTGEYNNNIIINKSLKDTAKTQDNMVVWTEYNKSAFPDLNYKLLKEPVKRVIAAPSFLQFEYSNTFLIFTRNTINRFVLKGEASGWSGSSDSLIEENTQFGLYADNTLVKVGKEIFWLSEEGVIRWNTEGMINISKNVINLGDADGLYNSDLYSAMYCPVRNQYILQYADGNQSFVYDLTYRMWTTFTGLKFDSSAILSGGSQAENVNLILNENEIFSYPGSDFTDEAAHIRTKDMFLDAGKVDRVRLQYIGDTNAQLTYQLNGESRNGDAYAVREHTISSLKANVWRGAGNLGFGRMANIKVENVEELHSIMFDVKLKGGE